MANNAIPISTTDLRRIRRYIRTVGQTCAAAESGVSKRTIGTIVRKGRCSRVVLEAVRRVAG